MDAKIRLTKKSVTCFLRCGQEFLFVYRNKKGNSVDFGRLNGVGGKLKPTENFFECAVREVKEETGYQVSQTNCRLAAVVNLEDGYADDWVMCFFVIDVPSKEIPLGRENDEGQLLWLDKDKVLLSDYQLVDDLYYSWEDIVADNRGTIFFSAQLDENEKIKHFTKTFLPFSK